MNERDKAYGEYAVSHWVEKRRGKLVLLGGRAGAEFAWVPVDKSVPEMRQHAELLSWGFGNRA